MYMVEKILDKKEEEGQVLYRIKWKDWPMSTCTWEPVENLNNIPDMLEQFNSGIQIKKGRGRPPGSQKKLKPVNKDNSPKEKRPRGRPKGSKKEKSCLSEVIALTEKETTDDMEVQMSANGHPQENYPIQENSEESFVEEQPKMKTFEEIIFYDVPEQVLSASKADNGQIFFFCRFKERNDGSRMEDSYICCNTMETYFHHLLFDYYKVQIFP